MAICWNHFLNLNFESKSAGNLNIFSYSGILREYTPEIICCNSISVLNLKNSSNLVNNQHKFISYLCGLIEGDGTIIILNPKDRLRVYLIILLFKFVFI